MRLFVMGRVGLVLVNFVSVAFAAVASAPLAKGAIPSLASHRFFAPASQRSTYSLDLGWKFELTSAANSSGYNCSADTFPNDLSGVQCMGLASQPYVTSGDGCRSVCCGDNSCLVWQWSGVAQECWTGTSSNCAKVSAEWVGEGRDVPPPTPAPATTCDADATPECAEGFDDSDWRTVEVPHDFVLEGTFTETADMSHGYLPFGSGWYRKAFTVPEAERGKAVRIDFEGVMVAATVYLNGEFLGTHASGYTPFGFNLDPGTVRVGSDGQNILVVFADATEPDGWWYDGGGIYRHVWLTALEPKVHLAQYGVYAPSLVNGGITPQTGSGPATGAATFIVSVDLESSLGAGQWTADAATVAASLVYLGVGGVGGDVTKVLASGSSAVDASGGFDVASVAFNLTLEGANLWSVEWPSLYRLDTTVTLSSGGESGMVADAVSTVLGVRRLGWTAENGFFLNEVPVKIKGACNHQDFAGLGVALPDHMQAHRISKLQEIGSNAWRTSHNAPTEALLGYTDAMGMLVWDENHRNGQPSEAAVLARRDRNHPSVVIWSICNEVLCDSGDGVAGPQSVADAWAIKQVFQENDPLGQRVVSANQNSWVNNQTVLDVVGYDYSTGSYDVWHAAVPTIPSISSETSSAVSDRGEYANDPAAGHVTGYDTEAPSWGQTAEQAWGGINEPKGAGILTRAWMSGGFTWTGFDYKGEPTPYSWPDINSHFGIFDIAGFAKDRAHWYKAWWHDGTGSGGEVDDDLALYSFPHWNWDTSSVSSTPRTSLAASPAAPHLLPCQGMCTPAPAGSGAAATVEVWAFTRGAEAELVLNGASLGRVAVPTFGHASWQVPYAPGTLECRAFAKAGDAAFRASVTTETTGPPTGLVLAFKDGVGGAGIADDGSAVALVAATVVDAQGRTVPQHGDVEVTFTVADVGGGDKGVVVAGTGSGDPADHTADNSPTRPAYHGLLLGILRSVPGVAVAGSSVLVTATAPGLAPSNALEVKVVASDFAFPRL